MAPTKKPARVRRTPKPGSEKYSLVLPVRNGGDLLLRSIQSIMRQTHRPSEILIYDTESTDGSIEKIAEITERIPLKVVPVRRDDFDHGGTRNAALKAARFPWVLYLTQDAVCADEATVANLFAPVQVNGVVAVYGRQLPHTDATPLAATARAANYGENLIVQNMAQSAKLGLKTWFTSNSFCLWQRKALVAAGGFAEHLILGEDMHAAARLVQAGATVIYEPAAQVFHSHNYTAMQELRRYFDIGVFHQMHANLLFRAGSGSKEGIRFVLTQAQALWRQRALLSLLRLPFHIAAKFLGYKLGRNFARLGKRLCVYLSMHKAFWQRYTQG